MRLADYQLHRQCAAVNDYRMGVFLRDLDHNRIRGSIGNLFDNPNDLALHLVTMVPLAIGLLFGLARRSEKTILRGLLPY